jgi:hypothetical protein
MDQLCPAYRDRRKLYPGHLSSILVHSLGGYAVVRLCGVVVPCAVAEGGSWQHQEGRPAARRHQEQR